VAKDNPDLIEAHLEDIDSKPSTTGILKASKTVDGRTKMPDESLWLWGRLRDWEKQNFFGKDPGDIFGGMTEGMQEDIRRILPMFLDWMQLLSEETK